MADDGSPGWPGCSSSQGREAVAAFGPDGGLVLADPAASGPARLILRSSPASRHTSATCSGDRRIYWYAPGTNCDSVWFWFNDGVNDYTSRAFTINGDYLPIVGDFDGDGFSDVYWYGADTTADTVWWGTTTRTSFGTTAYTGLTTDPSTATYTYGADGLRNAKTVNGTTTQFTWNTAGGLSLLLSQHQGSATTQIVYGPGGTPLYEVTGTTVTYYHQDHQGSTRLTTNSSGNAVARYAYDAYGDMTTNTAPTVATPILGYTGQYTDPETGFIYLRARYLDPTTGQFTSKDPIVDVTREPYSYVSGNPVSNVDPSGLLGIPFTDSCIDIMDDNCHSNADGESLRDTPGRVSEVCQRYCDDASNYASLVAAGAAFLCPFTGVSCAVASAAGGASLALSGAHTVMTCLDGLDAYCARSVGTTAYNAIFFGAGRGLTRGLVECGDSLGEATVWSQVVLGDSGLLSIAMNTTERPDTARRHRSHTDPEPR